MNGEASNNLCQVVEILILRSQYDIWRIIAKSKEIKKRSSFCREKIASYATLNVGKIIAKFYIPAHDTQSKAIILTFQNVITEENVCMWYVVSR